MLEVIFLLVLALAAFATAFAVGYHEARLKYDKPLAEDIQAALDMVPELPGRGREFLNIWIENEIQNAYDQGRDDGVSEGYNEGYQEGQDNPH